MTRRNSPLRRRRSGASSGHCATSASPCPARRRQAKGRGSLAETLPEAREDERGVRDKQPLVPRLMPTSRAHVDRIKLPDGPFSLDVARRGTLDNLKAEPIVPPAPGPGEI